MVRGHYNSISSVPVCPIYFTGNSLTDNNLTVVSPRASFSMRNRHRGSQLGLLLLASQLFQVGLDNIPPVTLAVLGLNVYLYLFPAAPLLQVMHVFITKLTLKNFFNVPYYAK